MRLSDCSEDQGQKKEQSTSSSGAIRAHNFTFSAFNWVKSPIGYSFRLAIQISSSCACFYARSASAALFLLAEFRVVEAFAARIV